VRLVVSAVVVNARVAMVLLLEWVMDGQVLAHLSAEMVRDRLTVAVIVSLCDGRTDAWTFLCGCDNVTVRV
jgi:hypothetical protein